MLANRYIVMSALVLTFIVAAFASPAAAAVAVGDKAPDFQLGSIDGKTTIKLSDYTDKPTLLVFWVSWCPHCQNMTAVEKKIYTDLGPKGLNVVGVSVDKDIDAASGFVKKHSLLFPNAFAGTDEGRNVATTYGIRGVPTFFVLDKGGIVKAVYSGEIGEDTIRQDFAELGVK